MFDIMGDIEKAGKFAKLILLFANKIEKSINTIGDKFGWLAVVIIAAILYFLFVKGHKNFK